MLPFNLFTLHMRIRIIAISDSDKHFSWPAQEYLKRLGKNVELVDLKPTKHGTPQEIISKETKIIAEKLWNLKWKDGKVFLLSKQGKKYTSEQFAQFMNKTQNCTFIIGGPYGLNEESLQNVVDESISFGSHTMPHGLAKVVLLEQIYRASCILSNKPYHY